MTVRQSKRSLKATNIGSSQIVQALMVHIDWTSAKVVKITSRKEFQLQASTVEVRKDGYRVLAEAKVNVPEGRTLYFVASDEFQGWYYVICRSGAGFGCSCPGSAQFHQECKHEQVAVAYEARREAALAQTRQAYECEVTKAEKFLALKKRFDVREQFPRVTIGGYTRHGYEREIDFKRLEIEAHIREEQAREEGHEKSVQAQIAELAA